MPKKENKTKNVKSKLEKTISKQSINLTDSGEVSKRQSKTNSKLKKRKSSEKLEEALPSDTENKMRSKFRKRCPDECFGTPNVGESSKVVAENEIKCKLRKGKTNSEKNVNTESACEAKGIRRSKRCRKPSVRIGEMRKFFKS